VNCVKDSHHDTSNTFLGFACDIHILRPKVAKSAWDTPCLEVCGPSLAPFLSKCSLKMPNMARGENSEFKLIPPFPGNYSSVMVWVGYTPQWSSPANRTLQFFFLRNIISSSLNIKNYKLQTRYVQFLHIDGWQTSHFYHSFSLKIPGFPPSSLCNQGLGGRPCAVERRWKRRVDMGIWGKKIQG